MYRRLGLSWVALLVVAFVPTQMPSVARAASPPPVVAAVSAHVADVSDDDDNFDIGSLAGTATGALIGAFAAIFGGIKSAQMQQRARRNQERRLSAEEERRRQAADVRRLVDLCTNAVADLQPFEHVNSLNDVDPNVRNRVQSAIIEAGGLQPFVRDPELKRAAKELLENAASAVANETLTATVRDGVVETARDRHRSLQSRASSVYEELVSQDDGAVAA